MSDPFARQNSDPTRDEEGGEDRRQLFERGWSMSDILESQRATSRASATASHRASTSVTHRSAYTVSPADLAHFHESWTTGGTHRASATHRSTYTVSPDDLSHFHESWTTSDTDGLFGAPFQQITLTPSIERPSTSHRTSSTAAASRVDKDGLSSAIHDAARITNWDKVLELCETNPEYAKYSGRDGWTALHHACNRRCPHGNVAEALIKAFPGALLQQEEKGWLPLHYACRFKAPKEVVRLLLHAYPEKGRKTVSIVDRMGRTPLYYAIRYDAPPGVVGLLLQMDPSAVLEEDQNEDSPLALVWDSWAEKLEGKRIVNSFLPGGFPEPENRTAEETAKLLRERLEKEPKLFKRWQKVNMLLKAAFGFPVEDDDEEDENTQSEDGYEERTWRIVHATAAVKCHLSLFLLAYALHPEQVQEFDESDLRGPGEYEIEGVKSHQTALHLAASSRAGGEPGKTVLLTLLSEYREAAQIPDGIDESLPLHRMVENPRKQDWSNHAAILYRFYPRAVQIPDAKGRLPLHRASAAYRHVEQEADESVVVQLVRAFPQAALQVDNTGCLPLHFIANSAEVWDHGVEAVFNVHRNAVLVRAGPSFFNRLPIHLAAANRKSRDSLISKLIHHHPRGASMTDAKGMLPLHLACEIGKGWEEGVHSIVNAFPAAVEQMEENARAWLPLHMAANAPESSVELIANLVELYPEGASRPDSKGNYPLHLACHSGKSWLGGIEALFNADPSPLSIVDSFGLLPFHLAALRFSKDDTEDEIEDASPKSMEIKHAQEAAKVDLLFNILRADPTILALTSTEDSGAE